MVRTVLMLKYSAFFLHSEPPELTCPQDIYVQKTNAGNTVNVHWPSPTYEDNSGEAVALFTESVKGSGFRVGRYQVKYVATDRSGNEASCIFTIVVSGWLLYLLLLPPVRLRRPPITIKCLDLF